MSFTVKESSGRASKLDPRDTWTWVLTVPTPGAGSQNHPVGASADPRASHPHPSDRSWEADKRPAHRPGGDA
jgi:hypothetical protein